MELLVNTATLICMALGGFFYFVGGLGMLRMPDVFTRMHAVSVTETVGVGFLILGMVIYAGFSLVSAKLIIIFLMLMVVSPVSSHALARAALHDGEMPLLANRKGWLAETNPADIFPELGPRLSQPLMSEQVEGDPRVVAVKDEAVGGYSYELDGDTSSGKGGTSSNS